MGFELVAALSAIGTLLLLSLPVFGLMALVLLHVRIAPRVSSPRHCPYCDYNRESIPDANPCPECGLSRRKALTRLQPSPPVRRYWVVLIPPIAFVLLALVTLPILIIGVVIVPTAVVISTCIVYASLRRYLRPTEHVALLAVYGTVFLFFGSTFTVLLLRHDDLSGLALIAAAYFGWAAASAALIISTPIMILVVNRR